jgi:hypothetical protein
VAQEELALTQKDLCNAVRCQLCEAVGSKFINLPEAELSVTQKDLCNTGKCLPEAELQNAVRASKGPDALSPSEGLEGQWASSTVEEAVGLFKDPHCYCPSYMRNASSRGQ